MRFVRVDYDNLINGPGVRAVLWVQGCSHMCRGCHNPETWDFNGGKEWTVKDLEDLIEYLNRDYVKGVTISGGDPLDKKNIEEVLQIAKEVKERTFKSVWVYTGHKFRGLSLLYPGHKEDIVRYIDVIVDGEFKEDKKVIGEYRGSSNQRYVDVVRSIDSDKIVEWHSEFDSKC